MSSHPIVRLTIPFVLGMVGANLFIPHINVAVMTCVCIGLVALMFICHASSRHNLTFGLLAMLTSFCIGSTLFTRRYRIVEQGLPTDSTFCMGVVQDLPKEKERSYELRIEQENGVHILLYIGKGGSEFVKGSNKDEEEPTVFFSNIHIGDTVLAKTKYLKPTNTYKGEYVYYEQYLFHNGICATAYAPRHKLMIVKNNNPSWFQRLRNSKQTLHELYTANGIVGDEGNVIETMTLGVKGRISRELRQQYAESGVSHVLALSGFHLGILVVILQFILFQNIPNIRFLWISKIATIGILWLFCIMTGMPSSLVRATIMCSLLLLFKTADSPEFSVDSCAITALAMLIINPLALCCVDFQLSFVSVIGIIAFRANYPLNIMPKWKVVSIPLKVAQISTICFVSSAPLVGYHFGYISLFSILSNLLVTPFVFATMYGSVAWWATLWLPSVNGVITDALLWSASTMNSITAWVASLPNSTIEWHPSVYGVICSYAIIGIAYFLSGYFVKNRKQEKK